MKKVLQKREELNAYARRYHQKRRQSIILAHGGKCECCGEKIIEFLTIITKRRKTVIVCKNCEWAKKVFGKCPHNSFRYKRPESL